MLEYSTERMFVEVRNIEDDSTPEIFDVGILLLLCEFCKNLTKQAFKCDYCNKELNSRLLELDSIAMEKVILKEISWLKSVQLKTAQLPALNDLHDDVCPFEAQDVPKFCQEVNKIELEALLHCKTMSNLYFNFKEKKISIISDKGNILIDWNVFLLEFHCKKKALKAYIEKEFTADDFNIAIDLLRQEMIPIEESIQKYVCLIGLVEFQCEAQRKLAEEFLKDYDRFSEYIENYKWEANNLSYCLKCFIDSTCYSSNDIAQNLKLLNSKARKLSMNLVNIQSSVEDLPVGKKLLFEELLNDDMPNVLKDVEEALRLQFECTERNNIPERNEDESGELKIDNYTYSSSVQLEFLKIYEQYENIIIKINHDGLTFPMYSKNSGQDFDFQVTPSLVTDIETDLDQQPKKLTFTVNERFCSFLIEKGFQENDFDDSKPKQITFAIQEEWPDSLTEFLLKVFTGAESLKELESVSGYSEYNEKDDVATDENSVASADINSAQQKSVTDENSTDSCLSNLFADSIKDDVSETDETSADISVAPQSNNNDENSTDCYTRSNSAAASLKDESSSSSQVSLIDSKFGVQDTIAGVSLIFKGIADQFKEEIFYNESEKETLQLVDTDFLIDYLSVSEDESSDDEEFYKQDSLFDCSKIKDIGEQIGIEIQSELLGNFDLRSKDTTDYPSQNINEGIEKEIHSIESMEFKQSEDVEIKDVDNAFTPFRTESVPEQVEKEIQCIETMEVEKSKDATTYNVDNVITSVLTKNINKKIGNEIQSVASIEEGQSKNTVSPILAESIAGQIKIEIQPTAPIEMEQFNHATTNNVDKSITPVLAEDINEKIVNEMSVVPKTMEQQKENATKDVDNSVTPILAKNINEQIVNESLSIAPKAMEQYEVINEQIENEIQSVAPKEAEQYKDVATNIIDNAVTPILTQNSQKYDLKSQENDSNEIFEDLTFTDLDIRFVLEEITDYISSNPVDIKLEDVESDSIFHEKDSENREKSRLRKRPSTSDEPDFNTNCKKRLCVKVASCDAAIDNEVNEAKLSLSEPSSKLCLETPPPDAQPCNFRARKISENRTVSPDLQRNDDDEGLVTEEQSSDLHIHNHDHTYEEKNDSSSNSDSDFDIVFVSPNKDNLKPSQSPQKLSSSKHNVIKSGECKVLMKKSFVFKVWFDKHKFFVVNDKDLRCLSGNRWLTGNIITFYLQYIIKKSNYQRKTHLFSTDFYDDLLRKQRPDAISNPSVQSLTRRRAIKPSDRQPRTKDDIYSKDFIVIPANTGGHWILIIITYLAQLTSETSSKKMAKKVPRIFVYDSLKSDNSGPVTRIKAFLGEEFKKMGKSFDEKNLLPGSVNRDKQQDCHSCGLFVYHFLEIFYKKKLFESNEELIIDEHFDPALKRKEVFELIVKERKTIISLE